MTAQSDTYCIYAALQSSRAQREKGAMDSEMNKEERRLHLLYSLVTRVVMSEAQGQSLKYHSTVTSTDTHTHTYTPSSINTQACPGTAG